MVIGFRAYPDGFAYVVLDGTQRKPVVEAHDRLSFPKDMKLGETLAWLRKQLMEILEKHKPNRACVKAVEPLSKKKSAERYRVEGIIIEVVHTTLKCECAIRIKSQLKRDIPDFKEPARYIERVLESCPSLKELKHPQYVEATVAAVAELKVE